ncbi:tyrosine-type recombinase/integrase [Hominicoprocola fusiformis]|jgi:integrase/recombinase XerD
MIYTFESHFAARIEAFISQKNALGFGYLESSRILRDFDRFCLTQFPDEDFLTEEICLAWATKKDTEGNNTFRNRMMPVREFARYLNRNGETAYILPPDIARKDAPYAPYIYTEAEILAIWNVLDHLTPRGGFPVRQFVIPAMVKLLYCCGLRPAEVRRLRVRDVDLDKGRLNIMESKQHRSRIVMMADDVVEMLSDCNAVVSAVMPEREPFFPNAEGGYYGKRGLEKTFRQTLRKAGIDGTGRRSPRLYDFRHTFATHRLYHWMREGKDLNAMLPYLSAYMGHAQLSDTYYYIHLVPGLLEEMSGLAFSSAEAILPEVRTDE